MAPSRRSARYLYEFGHALGFRASLRFCSGLFQSFQRAWKAFQALPQHLATLPKGCGSHAFELLWVHALRGIGGTDVDDSRHDLGRRSEGRAVHFHGEFRLAPPLGQHGKPAIMFSIGLGHDAFGDFRSEEHKSELQSLMRISYAVFCLTKKKIEKRRRTRHNIEQITYLTKILNTTHTQK